MSDKWIDNASRYLAQARTRRDVIRQLMSALVGALTLTGSHLRRSSAQSECGYGEVACGNTCVDVSYDDYNCGYCGNSCSRGSSCINGQCEGELDDYQNNRDCYTGQFCNDGFGEFVCVDLDWDSSNCGECGAVCPARSSCVSGECYCNIGDWCGYQCIDTDWDRLNCGSCGNVCFSGTKCITGRCESVDSLPTPSTSRPLVPFGLDRVTDSTLTATRFASILPSSFPGHELVTDVPRELADIPLYPGWELSSTYYYADPNRQPRTVVAIANASVLPPRVSPHELIIDQHLTCDSTQSCTVLSENASLDAAIVFHLSETLDASSSTPAYALIWSNTASDIVFTLRAQTRFGMENLAYGLVNNGVT